MEDMTIDFDFGSELSELAEDFSNVLGLDEEDDFDFNF